MAISNVASTTSSTALCTASNRRSTVICNSDTNDLYVLLDGGTASASNMSFIIVAKDNASLPSGYTGPVNGIWAGDGSGYAHITTY